MAARQIGRRDILKAGGLAGVAVSMGDLPWATAAEAASKPLMLSCCMIPGP